MHKRQETKANQEAKTKSGNKRRKPKAETKKGNKKRRGGKQENIKQFQMAKSKKGRHINIFVNM